MHIEVTGEDSISPQPRTYAEYRLFAALSEVVDTGRVRAAAVDLRRKFNRHCDGVVCSVRVELEGDVSVRVRTWGPHPYAAINRAMDRLRINAWRTVDSSVSRVPNSREVAL